MEYHYTTIMNYPTDPINIINESHYHIFFYHQYPSIKFIHINPIHSSHELIPGFRGLRAPAALPTAERRRHGAHRGAHGAARAARLVGRGARGRGARRLRLVLPGKPWKNQGKATEKAGDGWRPWVFVKTQETVIKW